jgi:hypothetical protein
VTRTTTALAVAAAALAVGLAASGCTGGTASGGGSSSSSATGGSTAAPSPSPTTAPVRADATDSAPPPRPSPTAVGLGLAADERYTGGDGGLSWEVELPVFTTGPADAVNRKVRASADFGARAAGEAGVLEVSGRSRVVTNDGRTVQVRIALGDAAAADPGAVVAVTTVALTADDASPVFLEQQLADPGTAWAELVQQAGAAAAADGFTNERPLEATAAQFADWQTSESGLELSFQHGEYGPGAPLVLVPWSVVEPLLTPEGQALLAP